MYWNYHFRPAYEDILPVSTYKQWHNTTNNGLLIWVDRSKELMDSELSSINIDILDFSLMVSQNLTFSFEMDHWSVFNPCLETTERLSVDVNKFHSILSKFSHDPSLSNLCYSYQSAYLYFPY